MELSRRCGRPGHRRHRARGVRDDDALVGRVGATRGSSVTYSFPIVAIVLGVLLLDEDLHPIALVGTALVIVGAYVLSRAERTVLPTPPVTG